MSKTPTEIKSLARAHSEAALKTLVGIMNQPSAADASRVAAANSLLDRGWGKPAQTHHGDDDAPAIKHSHNITVTIVDTNGGSEEV